MTIHHGDCLDVMASMEPESVDAIVTDPPYLLGFMGKEWDKAGRQGVDDLRDRHPDPTGKSVSPFYRPGWGNSAVTASTRDSQAWHQQWAEAALRVAKPSAYLLAFGGTRTVHRMTVALEDAGWIIRDMLVWGYASGFPKSKASLKPAWEPIVMARKPGPLRELAIDACRIPTDDKWDLSSSTYGGVFGTGAKVTNPEGNPAGRWPANIILTDPIFDGGIEGVVGGGESVGVGAMPQTRGPSGYSGGWDGTSRPQRDNLEPGTYSRFFLIPKADRSDREPVLGGLPERVSYRHSAEGRNMSNPKNAMGEAERRRVERGEPGIRPRANHHPTVKPTDLMRHLVRLVTPTGGTVLDPFLGSGTTGIACELEGFPWIGIEREAEYVAIAEARLNGTQKGLGLAG